MIPSSLDAILKWRSDAASLNPPLPVLQYVAAVVINDVAISSAYFVHLGRNVYIFQQCIDECRIVLQYLRRHQHISKFVLGCDLNQQTTCEIEGITGKDVWKGAENKHAERERLFVCEAAETLIRVLPVLFFVIVLIGRLGLVFMGVRLNFRSTSET